MQFNIGAKVFTADGEQVGSIDRVVIQPHTKEVTHLVVQKGLLFTEDKVIPTSLVGSATEEQVSLRKVDEDLDEFPNFIESHFVPVDRGPDSVPVSRNLARTFYWYPPIGGYGGFAAYATSRFVVKSEPIPGGSVALDEGANVISSDGEHVGDVERVLTESLSDRATHLLISEGLFLKEKKLVPTIWIKHAFEHEIRLSVDSKLVENLPEYQVQD
jgi:uncharacterized protein YrrD